MRELGRHLTLARSPAIAAPTLGAGGSASLDGTLDVILFGGFVPSAGYSKLVIDTLDPGGTTFSTESFPNLGVLTMTSSYSASGVQLDVN